LKGGVIASALQMREPDSAGRKGPGKNDSTNSIRGKGGEKRKKDLQKKKKTQNQKGLLNGDKAGRG